MNRPLRRLMRGESGQELIEFALASLIFLITVFGTLEFGLGVWQYNMVSDLAQEGARWASVRGSTSSILHASSADVQTYVQGRSTGVTVTVTATPDPSTLAPGATVSVLVQTTFSPLTSLIPFAAMTLQSTAQMVIAR